jgi:hypothetical protein
MLHQHCKSGLVVVSVCVGGGAQLRQLLESVMPFDVVAVATFCAEHSLCQVVLQALALPSYRRLKHSATVNIAAATNAASAAEHPLR